MVRMLRLEQKKEDSLIEWTLRKSFVPGRAVLSLRQNFQDETIPCVQAGEEVRTGQKIAEPADDFSTALHASISGKISKIAKFPHPLFGESPAIEIISDGSDQPAAGVGKEREGWQLLPPAELRKVFRECGVTDMIPGGRPIHLTAEPLSGQKRILIVNACEADPYVAQNYFLILSRTVDVLKGAEILQKAVRAEEVILACDSDKEQAAELLRSKIYLNHLEKFQVMILPNRHPLDMTKVLEETIRGKTGRKKYGSKPAEFLTLNLATALAAYEAVAFQKPLYERALTLAGECIVEPKNVWVRNGSPFEEVMRAGRKMLREPGKVIMGGPLRGIAQKHLDVPVLKITQAILALAKETAKPESEEACIRCGDCLDVCPAGISPVMLTLAAEHGETGDYENYGLSRCILCGNCAYVCPSKRPMVELIRRAFSEQADKAAVIAL